MVESANTPWVIELRTPQMSEPLRVRLDDRLIIGRFDQTQSKQPDVNLAPYEAEAQGVSRHHLELYVENDQLMVTDLGSGNGTMLNGEKLESNKPAPIAHGDHLQLGHMRLDLRVIISPTYGSGFHKQPSLQLRDQVHRGSGQNVLIVEDDPEVAKVLAIIIERAGYTTQTSREVVGAIRIFNQKRPNAIILDLMLPDMHGLEFCRYVRRDVQHNTTPIVVVSAAKTATNVTQAMQAGADIFLGKPVSAKELRHVITSLITQHEGGGTSIHTKHLVGTAPLQAIPPETRRDAVVLFVAGHNDAPIAITLQQPVSFGRSANLPSRAHIDLSRYDAIDHGVSRVHMVLHNKDGRFFIEDADSVNGTYLNGDPLKPHDLMPLRNADEIRLGRLRMYIYFLEDVDMMNRQSTILPSMPPAPPSGG